MSIDPTLKPFFQFHLIANRIDITAPLPFEITPGYQLRRATGDEIARIQRDIRRYCNWFRPSNRFEFDIRVEQNGDNSSTRSFDPLPPDNFRYWVIIQDCSDPQKNPFYSGLWGIERASHLLGIELEIPFNFCEPEGFGTNTYFQRRFDENDWFLSENPITIDTEYLSRLRGIMDKMHLVVVSHPNIKRSIDMLFQLRNIDKNHELHLLGLFAVLESLLTHNPKGVSDSLVHQICSKIILLNRRFDTPLNYSEFSTADVTKLWKGFYECRSRIAHGGELVFAADDLKKVKSYNSVHNLVSSAVKAVLRLALIEPDLISDLRAC